MNLLGLRRELHDRREELDLALKDHDAARQAVEEASRAFVRARAAYERAKPPTPEARLEKRKTEILEDHAWNYRRSVLLLDTSPAVVMRELKKAAAFVEKLHPAARAALEEACPGTLDYHLNKNMPSWTEAPRDAIRSLFTDRHPLDDTPWTKTRGGQNRQRARDEFLRRLAQAYRACGMKEEGLYEFVRDAAEEARPPVKLPENEDSLLRILDPRRRKSARGRPKRRVRPRKKA